MSKVNSRELRSPRRKIRWQRHGHGMTSLVMSQVLVLQSSVAEANHPVHPSETDHVRRHCVEMMALVPLVA